MARKSALGGGQRDDQPREKAGPGARLRSWPAVASKYAAMRSLRFTNMDMELRDSELYSVLLAQIAPARSGVPSAPMASQGGEPAASAMISHARKLGLVPNITPAQIVAGDRAANGGPQAAGEVLTQAQKILPAPCISAVQIAEGCPAANAAFVAQLFSLHPALPPHEDELLAKQRQSRPPQRLFQTRADRTHSAPNLPADIASGCPAANVAFVAQLFRLHPALPPHEDELLAKQRKSRPAQRLFHTRPNRTHSVPNLPADRDLKNENCTRPGTTAGLNWRTGSWFTRLLVEVFAEHAHNQDIVRLMGLVDTAMRREHGQLQLPRRTHTLKKKFFFVPSLESEVSQLVRATALLAVNA